MKKTTKIYREIMKVNLNKERERERERNSVLLNEKSQYYGQDVNSLYSDL